MELGETTRYLELSERTNVLTDGIREAGRKRDLYLWAALRLERATVELELRDLFGQSTSRGRQWNTWMWDDIEQAKKAADRLEEKIGDSQILPRLLNPFPQLQRLAS